MNREKPKPKIDFTRNRLLRKVFNEYDVTFSLTLDTADYIDKKYLSRYKKYVWKDMKRSLKKVPSVSRRLISLAKKEFYAKLLEKAEKDKHFKKCVLQESRLVLKSLSKYNRGLMKEIIILSLK